MFPFCMLFLVISQFAFIILHALAKKTEIDLTPNLSFDFIDFIIGQIH